MGAFCFLATSTASVDAESVETPRLKSSDGVRNCESFTTNPQRGSFADLRDYKNFHSREGHAGRSRTGTRCGSFATMVTRVQDGYDRDSFKTEPQRDSFNTMITRVQGRESFATERSSSFRTTRRASFQTLPNRDSFEEAHQPNGGRHDANGRLTEKALQTHDNEVIAKRFAALRLGS